MVHSRTLVPLLTRMGLYNDSMPLLSENYDAQKERQFRLSLINPFAANVAFVLYSCMGKYYARTFVNEKEVILPVCHTTFCPLEVIEKGYRQILDTCDFDTLCENHIGEPIDLDEIAKLIHINDVRSTLPTWIGNSVAFP